jgi:hypothetical protein
MCTAAIPGAKGLSYKTPGRSLPLSGFGLKNSFPDNNHQEDKQHQKNIVSAAAAIVTRPPLWLKYVFLQIIQRL